eukprot:m.72471 g.72471  ORF g.72471 m.72471 type:complete len:64 (-) comp8385_c0_seq2:36-227(-)
MTTLRVVRIKITLITTINFIAVITLIHFARIHHQKQEQKRGGGKQQSTTSHQQLNTTVTVTMI